MGHLITNKIPPKAQFHKLYALGVLGEVNKHIKLEKKENIYCETYPMIPTTTIIKPNQTYLVLVDFSLV